ncbi:MAG: S-adenosylmethionine decarboxylase [Bacteroidetes bacterium]|nr:S-adenosylmethionine decarboxylase [Bacteroidota bacterium]
MNTQYNPGLHYLATLQSKDSDLLKDMQLFREWLDAQIVTHHLTQVGDVWHRFPDAGFTGAVALTESHISIHTWPEYNLATFDVFLSNFSRRNDAVVVQLAQDIARYFKAELSNIHQIAR